MMRSHLEWKCWTNSGEFAETNHVLGFMSTIQWEIDWTQWNVKPQTTSRKKINSKLDTHFKHTPAHSKIIDLEYNLVMCKPSLIDHMFVYTCIFNGFKFIPDAFKPNTARTHIQSGMRNTSRSNYYYASYPHQCLDFNTKLTKETRKKMKMKTMTESLKPNQSKLFPDIKWNEMKWNGCTACIRAHHSHNMQHNSPTKYFWIRHFVTDHE